jgi:hypothetical protein
MGMGRRPLPAMRDFTRDYRWSTYDMSVLKKMCVGRGGGRCAQTRVLRHPLKLPSPTKLARLDHFLPASQAGRHAGLMFSMYMSFLWYKSRLPCQSPTASQDAGPRQPSSLRHY